MSDDLTQDQRRIAEALRDRRGITLDVSRPIVPTASPPTEPATAPPAQYGADLHETWAKGYERGQLDGLAAGLAAGRRQAADAIRSTHDTWERLGKLPQSYLDGVADAAGIVDPAPAEPVEEDTER